MPESGEAGGQGEAVGDRDPGGPAEQGEGLPGPAQDADQLAPDMQAGLEDPAAAEWGAKDRARSHEHHDHNDEHEPAVRQVHLPHEPAGAEHGDRGEEQDGVDHPTGFLVRGDRANRLRPRCPEPLE